MCALTGRLNKRNKQTEQRVLNGLNGLFLNNCDPKKLMELIHIVCLLVKHFRLEFVSEIVGSFDDYVIMDTQP